MNGNPVCKKIQNYRKVLITQIPCLKYLDDRPVFDEDRRYAEAWSRGGVEEERKERQLFKKEKDDAHWQNHDAFKEMIRKAREEKKQAEEETIKCREEEAKRVLAESAAEAVAEPAKANAAEGDAESSNENKDKAPEEPKVNEGEDDLPPELEEVDVEKEQ